MILRQLCLLLAVFTARTIAQGQTQYQTIGNGADVIFVLDGSQRVTAQQWIYLQNWLQQLTEYWNIGPQGVQVGFYTYGGGSHAQYQLRQAGNYQQAFQEIQGLTLQGGSATAGQAIRQAYREGFTSQNGGRAGVPKIIVHVSSGPGADPTFYQQEVTEAKQSGVIVYNVGIGAGATTLPSDLTQVASEPSTRYVLTAQNYQTLGSLSSSLAARVANELPSGPGQTLPTGTGCLNQADIVFLVDGSSSVGEHNFQALQNYVKTFSSQLPVSQQGVHVGVMQFSSRPSVEFGLGVYTDKASLLKGIDNIQYMGGGTNTADAINAMRTQMFSQSMGARPGVPRIAVVITDGRSSSIANTVKEADLARNDHISLLAVGVGSGVNAAELQGIADRQQDVFQVDNYDNLPTLTSGIMQMACQVQVTAPPQSATVGTNVNDPCKDSLATCNQYDANICTDYRDWASDNCQRTCGICSPLTPDVLLPCTDKLTNCGDYESTICTDSKFVAWSTDNCALYCGLCGADTTSNGYYGQCFYKGKSYNTGETWDDGCDYQCTCEDGSTGHYKCYNKCPLYSGLPAECTLVQNPGDCCLKPVCNFNPTIQSSITSGLGQTPDGMNVCDYQGNQYVQGESWDVGCSLKCTCEEAATGKIRCQDYCPTYTVLPNNCHLQQSAGECCAEPVCEFNTQSGIISGQGQTSGKGAVTQPTNPPPCVDRLDNCAQYTQGACQNEYVQWAADNCRAYCNLCGDGRVVPTDRDRCSYMGKQYKQGETWSIGCDQECVCEQAVFGYYRCHSLCPTYTNVPATCTRSPASGTACCETITCTQTTRIVPSTTNVLSIGSGNNIYQPNPSAPSQLIPVVPSISPDGSSSTATQGFLAPTIKGCLYKGQLYVQGQRWDDGCQRVCECASADQGLYSCAARCPTYQNLPLGCNLEPDPADACCSIAVCQPSVSYIPVPVFNRGTVSTGVVQPPSPNELMATSSSVVVTQQFPQSANSPPTMPSKPVPTGGIGFCVYKNQRYSQSEKWTDGCDYNCLCEDASRGYWVCSDMCLSYPPMPQYCRLVVDQDFPCCRKPYCEIPGYVNSTFGIGSTQRPVITTMPPFVVTTTTPPRPAMCIYKGQEYSQGQEWFDACNYKCTCYDAKSNLYSCNDRCPTFYGLDESRCTQQPDPRDPTCCTIPVCTPPVTPAAGNTPVPTVPGGSFENTNAPGIVGYCDYKGTRYVQGEKWEDGCQYSCECLDASNGRYRCDEKCPRFPSLPSQCRLVTDFANPCCQKPTCNFNPQANTISGQANLNTPAPMLTPAPGGRTPVCDYRGVQYNQGQTWDDGCNYRCRCEDAERGLYVCDDRCAKYSDLPSQCVLVADPTDQCCRIPQCSFTPTSGGTSGQGSVPPVIPTAKPGQIQGQVNVPTPAPGQTPPPIGFCVYKGQEYRQGETWEDGCDYTCVCEDAGLGKYICDEKCPKFPNLPAQCRLVRDPAKPCCTIPDCSFTPTSGGISGVGVSTPAPQPGSTVSPPIIPGQTTVAPRPGQSTVSPPPGQTNAPNVPNLPSTVTPSPTPVCVYRGQVYAEGQTWYDGCDYVCVCEMGSRGTYRCNDRCPSYPVPQGESCTMTPDPKDPMCCRIPECETPEPTPIGPNGPYIVPTLGPPGEVTGGSVTLAPTPGNFPTPAPGVSTVSPPPGQTAVPQPREVCIYKAQEYAQGQKWQDGCDYNCECIDAPNGHYRCTEICPRYPPVAANCYMVLDVYNPCCHTPVCPNPPTVVTTTVQPTPGVTQVPPTGPDGQTLRPPVISTPTPRQVCLYNGVPYHTGDTWDDGCDLRCRCEDENKNIYRCDQRCARYDITSGCTMVTDPRDSCCLVPFCQPVMPPTAAPNPNPNQPATPAPVQVPIPTAIPGKTVGNSVGSPNSENPDERDCSYNGKAYQQSETWLDGCDKICVCVDQKTGRYECTERCPLYLNVPSYCSMIQDQNDQCCEKPVCTPPIGVTNAPNPQNTNAPNPQNTNAPNPQSTNAPNPQNTNAPNPQSTNAPNPQNTNAPNPNATPSPSPGSVPVPQPRNVCNYKNAVYVQGQQWYDGCDKSCVCEDGTTGYYRCADRCSKYDSVPSGCTLVVDPKDPTCCKVPQCAPTPGPLGYPTPPPGVSPTPFTVTNVPGVITGSAPPTPTPGPNGQTPQPQPRNVCVYNGRSYTQEQRWQDGCNYNCVCVNEMTGEYKCTERCNKYPLVPPQCTLSRDPADYCCQIMTCDLQKSTPNPYLTLAPQPSATAAPNLGPTTPSPSPNPNQPVTPRPVPQVQPVPTSGQPSVPNPASTTPPPYVPQTYCVYNGVPYRQGDTWTEGCSKTCRCDDSDRNYYNCYDRCPKYSNVSPACTMVLNPNDNCCQMPVCPEIPTASPTFGPGFTPGPGAATPAPTPTPFPVPQKVPIGSVTATQPNNNPTGKDSVCVYMGNTYTQGQTWDDGCNYNCTCIDATTGRYVCDERCAKYVAIPPNCILMRDPADQCCMKPACTNPVTQSPPLGTTRSPPGTVTQVPPQGTLAPGQTTQAPPLQPGQSTMAPPLQPGQSTVAPPLQPGQTPSPTVPAYNPTPVPRTLCVMNGRTYTQGQQWYDGCSQICVCEDEITGFYRCRQRCQEYLNNNPLCVAVPDPSDPTCCTIPNCPNPNNPDIPEGQKGTFTGNGQPTPSPYATPQPSGIVTPAPGQTFAPNQQPSTLSPQPGVTQSPQPGVTQSPQPGVTQVPQLREVCVYKGQEYTAGQRWRDGCDYECVCVNGMTGEYKCTDRCAKYPPLSSPNCRMVRDPSDACCQVPDCSPTPAPSVNPGQNPTLRPGETPTATPNPIPRTDFCVYQGVLYRQGQSWNDGCDKVCRCEDGMTGLINCDDRCPTYPNVKVGCIMVTDPQDSCCQIPQCQNSNTNNPNEVITGVPGTIEGSSVPPDTPNPNPLQPRNRVCVYRGVEYQQGQQWDDGCSYTCVCDDAMTSHYTCTERCARVPSIPSTCHQVPDPADLCCQVVSCPVNNPQPQPQSTLAPTPYTGPPTQAPPPYTGPPTLAPPIQPGQATPAPYTGPPTLSPPPYSGPPTMAPPLGSTVAPNPFTAVPQPREGLCLYKNQYYREKQVWYDGCSAICTCEDGNTGFYRCQERCGDYQNVDSSCIMTPDPKDPTCCQVPDCPLIQPGQTTPAGPSIIRPPQPTAVFTNYPSPAPTAPVTQPPPTAPGGATLVPPPASTKAPTPRTGCLYNGRTYHENEQWEDGCQYTCECLSDMTGQYRCAERCPRMPSVPQGCVLITDPDDACCQVPYCDFGPNPFPNGIPTPNPSPTSVPGLQTTTPLYFIPGYVTVSGNNPTTPNPNTINSHTGGTNDICVYNGVMYRQGQQWNDGCDKTCICDINGLYTCRDRCQSFPNLDAACVLRTNPADQCCLVPDCNPNYVTPAPGTGFTGSNPNVSPGTGTGFTGANITPVPGSGVTGSNPSINPGVGPGFTGTRAPILVPTAAPAVFTGQRPPIQGSIPSITGYSTMCVYKGVTYQQGQKWDDACQYKCECIDAIKGTYRCTERCSNFYFMPSGCIREPDPNDSCCQRALCSPDSFPTPTPIVTVSPALPPSTAKPATVPATRTTPQTITLSAQPGPIYQGTRSPVGSTITSFTGKPSNMCVYTDGRSFRQGDTWTDGCAYNCVCEDAVQNTYKCDFRCPVYSEMPTYCKLVDDPLDQCCQKVSCSPVAGKPLEPVIGTNQPTQSPTMQPGITNIVPIGTHTVISGSGLAPGETRPGFFGGREVCVYKSVIYQPGEKWDDGCDYTCECLEREPAIYSCTSKCPKYPPLPQYCSMVEVPGQCCPSMKCNIPDAGPYTPIPQLYPKLIPTPAPGATVQNPQLLLPGGYGSVTSGNNPPGGGYILPNPSSVGGISDRCVYLDSNGQYRVYLQGETWVVNSCDYNCECIDSQSGYYQCTPICPDYGRGQLPTACTMEYVQGQCCPAVRCTNPDGTITEPSKNPSQTMVPVFGVIGTGYAGFRPGYVPGHSNTIAGQSNVCVYKGTPHQQGEHWDDGCQYSCDCTDASTGLYTCRRQCTAYTTLPPVCHLVRQGTDCCPKVQCETPNTTPSSGSNPPSGSSTQPSATCTTPDKMSNCNQYDKTVACVGQYEAWARDNCAVYCGYCKDTNPTTPGPCIDTLANCDQYGASACVGQYEPWARDNCAKTCNLCPCYDKITNCNQYGPYACGGQYLQWATDNCASTCGLCPGSQPITANPPSGITGSGVVPNGWLLLLKGVAGAPGDLWTLWNSPNTANTNVPAAKRLTSEFMGHYKPAISNSLSSCEFDRIKVGVFNNGLEMASVTFDGHGGGRDSWFSSSNIIDSTFTDIRSMQQFLQMAGDPATGHEFFIGQPVTGCTGSGWIMVSTRNTCTYEAGTNPGFYYSSTGTSTDFNSGHLQSGDVFAIMGQGGTCSLGITTPRTATFSSQACVYGQKIYHQNDWWQDGCQFNCTCENASSGFYRCYDLCLTYTNLPPNCNLVKPDGECCAVPTGPGCPGPHGTPSCLYKGKVYQQGQTWDDGCDYTCECVDGATGRYQCTSMCLIFQLPEVCHFDPAPQGMCCQVPVCPANINIQYPPGYTPR